MLVIALIGLACYCGREFLLWDVKEPELRIGSHCPCDPGDMLYREDLEAYQRWRWASGPEMDKVRAIARSLLGLDQEMKGREGMRKASETQLRMDCTLRAAGVDPTKWSQPTPGQRTKIKQVGKYSHDKVEPLRVYTAPIQPGQDQLYAHRVWEHFGITGDLSIAVVNDGTGELFHVHSRKENDAEKQAREQRQREELRQVASFVRNTGKAPTGWVLRPHKDPPQYVDIVSEDETQLISMTIYDMNKRKKP